MPSASAAFTVDRVSSVRTAARSPALTASMRVVVPPAALKVATESASRATNELDRNLARTQSELVHLAVVLVRDREKQVRERRLLLLLDVPIAFDRAAQVA